MDIPVTLSKNTLLPILLCLYPGSQVFGDEPQDRFGLLTPAIPGVEVGMTMIWQAADDENVDRELLASLDVVGHWSVAGGAITLYVEGSTTPGSSAVSSSFPEANGDAGSALNKNGEGRVQVSELFYEKEFGPATVFGGLLNPTSSLDNSDLMNDETSQFLATPLVNNPTIGFPDYSLGGLLHHEPSSNLPGFNLFISSSHGLGDNPNASYDELFHIGDDEKGFFTAIEAYNYSKSITWRFGAWHNSADHEQLDNPSKSDTNYGMYMVLDGETDLFNWSHRLGIANPKSSAADRFIALAISRELTEDLELGAGFAHTMVSRELPNDLEDQSISEIYLKKAIKKHAELSLSIQYLDQANFADPESVSGWIGSVRVSVVL